MSGQEYHSSIQLFNENGNIHSDKYYTDLAQMEDTGFDYVKLQVEKMSGMGAVWVVYSEPNFGRAGTGTGQSYIVLTHMSSTLIAPGFPIRSFQGFNVTQPCMCLFEHYQYMGNKYSTNRSLDDINDRIKSPGCRLPLLSAGCGGSVPGQTSVALKETWMPSTRCRRYQALPTSMTTLGLFSSSEPAKVDGFEIWRAKNKN